MARLLLSCPLVLLLMVADVPTVTAQDDWGLTRERPRPGARRPGRARPGRARPGRARPRARARRPSAQTQTETAGPRGRNAALIERYLRILEADPRETFAFRRLLDLYRERDGNIDTFVRTLEARVETAGDDTAEHYAPTMMLGHIYKAQNRLPQARSSYSRAAQIRPREAAPLVALAQVERAASNPAAARTHYDSALERTRERTAREELLREVAGLVMETQDFDGARTYFEQLTQGGEARSSVYLRSEYARALAGARQWGRAVEEFQRVLRSLRGDNRVLPPILVELSRAQLEHGDVQPSIETLDRALRIAGRQAGIRAEIYDQMLTAHRRANTLRELADRLRREAGRGFESNELLGRILDELGDDDEALAAYRRAVRARPREIDSRLRIIQLLSLAGRLDDVVEEYRALIRSAPREPRFVIELAGLLVQRDQRDDALALLRDTGRRHPRDPVLHQQLAELYSRWEEDELASREIQLLVRIDPRDPAHLIALGAQQFSAGDRDAAITTWRRVLEIESDAASGHAALAGILADHDLLPQSVEQYREAVRLSPDNITFVRGLATSLERNHDNVAAEEQWARVLELAGDDRVARREARERIVGIWNRTRRLPTQIRELERRFATEPPDAEAGRFLAEAYRRRGPQHQAQAERVLERVVTSEPGDVESLLALERIRRHRSDLAGAIEVLERLRRADPSRAGHYLQQMTEHAHALYRDDDALSYATQAVQLNPDDASAHRRLGDLYRARQETGRAMLSYRRALELNDRLHPVYFELAEMHLAQSEAQAADQLYRQVLAITPDDDLVARAARASIQINLGAGSLEALEADLLPLTLGNPQRPIFRRMAVELYDAYAGPLVARARRGGPGSDEARVALRRIGTRSIKPLLEALADQDPAQRRVALDVLGDLGNPNAAAPLLAVAENSSLDIHQRLQALTAAGSVSERALVPRFVALATGDDTRMQGLAAWGLARIGGREATQALSRMLTDGDDLTTSAFAAIGLGLHGGSSAVHDLSALIRRRMASPNTGDGTNTDEDVVLAAAWALGQTGDRDAAELLATVLSSFEGSTALVAADALGELGGATAEAALVRALFDPDPHLRRAAARAIRRTRRGERANADDDPSSEREAAAAMPAPRSFERVRDYVPRLIDVSAEEATSGPPDLSQLSASLSSEATRALNGPAERVLAALEVLGAPSGESATTVGLGPLTSDLADWPDADQTAARTALAELSSALMDELISRAEHLDAAVRVEVVRLLVRLPGEDAERSVASSLRAPPASVQRAGLEALAALGRTPGPLITARLASIVADHDDWSMRTRAARALARSSEPGARATLRRAMLEDRYAFVRQAAARAISTAPQPDDAVALRQAVANDSERRVRAEAARGLSALGGNVAARQR